MKQLYPPGPSLRFEVRGVEIYVNWSLPFLGAAIAYLPAKHAAGSPVANYLVALISLIGLVVLHELGHACAAKICSMRVHAIVLSGYGGCCVAEVSNRLSHAAIFAAGGLIAQLLVLGLTLGFLQFYGTSSHHAINSAVFVLVGANILYMLVNIAPIQGSDGAKLLDIAKKAIALRSRRGS